MKLQNIIRSPIRGFLSILNNEGESNMDYLLTAIIICYLEDVGLDITYRGRLPYVFNKFDDILQDAVDYFKTECIGPIQSWDYVYPSGYKASFREALNEMGYFHVFCASMENFYQVMNTMGDSILLPKTYNVNSFLLSSGYRPVSVELFDNMIDFINGEC